MAPNHTTARRSTQRQPVKQKSSAPAFFIGLLIGALGMYVAPLLLQPQQTLDKASTKPSTESNSALKFDFYTLLKNSEIIVPNNESLETDKGEPEQNFAYLLQVGSFKNSRDAQELRVQLLLLNLNASTETFSSDSGEKWHRVLVGPFANTSKMASARARLAENDLHSLLLKRRL